MLQQLRVIASVLSQPLQRPRLRLQLVASLGLGGLDKWLKSRGSLWPPPGRPRRVPGSLWQPTRRWRFHYVLVPVLRFQPGYSDRLIRLRFPNMCHSQTILPNGFTKTMIPGMSVEKWHTGHGTSTGIMISHMLKVKRSIKRFAGPVSSWMSQQISFAMII